MKVPTELDGFIFLLFNEANQLTGEKYLTRETGFHTATLA